MASSRRNVFSVAAVAVAALALALHGEPLFAKGAPKATPAKPPPPTPKAKDKDIVETLAAFSEPSAKTLLEALKAADLTSTLKGTGPFTLFAPTDEALKKFMDGKFSDLLKPDRKAELKALLNDHIVSGKLLAADIAKVKTLKSAGGHTLNVKVSDSKAWSGVEDATVTKTDVTAGNGVIHFMDAPIVVPKTEPGKGDPGMSDPAMGDPGMSDPGMTDPGMDMPAMN